MFKLRNLNKLGALFTSSLLVFGLSVAPSFAQTPSQPATAALPAGPINWESLELSPAQVKQINLLRLNYNQTAIRLKADISIKQLEIQKQLMLPANNPNVIRQLLQEKLSMESKLQAASLDNFLAIRKVLTPKQLANLSKAVTIR